MFAYPGCEMSGGISLVEDGVRREAMMAGLAEGGKGAAAAGMMTYFLVASIEEVLEVSTLCLRHVWFGVWCCWEFRTLGVGMEGEDEEVGLMFGRRCRRSRRRAGGLSRGRRWRGRVGGGPCLWIRRGIGRRCIRSRMGRGLREGRGCGVDGLAVETVDLAAFLEWFGSVMQESRVGSAELLSMFVGSVSGCWKMLKFSRISVPLRHNAGMRLTA